jgi:hypothetical protein
MTRQPVKHITYYDEGSQVEMTYRAPLSGMYAYALYDYHTVKYFRPKDARGNWGYSVPRMLQDDRDHLPNDDGFPHTVPFSPRDGVRLTEKIQWFMVAQLTWSKYRIDILEKDIDGRSIPVKSQFYQRLTRLQQDFIKAAWKKLTRDDTAFTNHSGTWNKKTGEATGIDFINETGAGLSYPRLWELGCGGSTYLINQKEIPAGATSIELKALRVKDYHIWRSWKFTDPRYRCFFTFATNITPYLVGTRDTFTEVGPWRVNQMDMLLGPDVILPVLTENESGVVTVAADRVKIISQMYDYPYPYTQ